MADSQTNVLLLAGCFEVRGTSAYTLRLAEHLSEVGFAPRVICTNAAQVDPRLRERFSIIEYGHLTVPLVGRLVAQYLRRDLEVDPPELVHIQSRAVLSTGAWLARQLNVPSVLTVHDYLAPRERLEFDPAGGRVIAVSRQVKDDLLERTTLTGDAVTVIHSGVETTVRSDTLAILDPGHTPVVGAAGPLEAIKGFPYFLGAAQRVLARRGDVEFLISGAGPEEHNLRRLARELEIIDHVTFVPNLFDYSESLVAMDVFCLTSLRQGLGTIMIEAMAFGKPVIATDVGGVHSVVTENETGLVVPPADSEQLAEKILQLLDDPVKARSMGAAAAAMVRQEFDVRQMVERTAELYRSVLEVEAT